MELWVLTVCILVAVISLLVMCAFSKHGNIDNIVNAATNVSAFKPTIFQIYDRSTKDHCDRLIRIRPFDWYVWACRGELYILNPEGGIQCGMNSTPAIRVYADQFVETCLNIDYDSILNSYARSSVKHVEYDISGTKVFTVLSALNLLVRDWITFATETVRTRDTFVHPRKRRSVDSVIDKNEMLRVTDRDSLSNARMSRTQLSTMLSHHRPKAVHVGDIRRLDETDRIKLIR